MRSGPSFLVAYSDAYYGSPTIPESFLTSVRLDERAVPLGEPKRNVAGSGTYPPLLALASSGSGARVSEGVGLGLIAIEGPAQSTDSKSFGYLPLPGNLVWSGKSYGMAWLQDRQIPRAITGVSFGELDDVGVLIGAPLALSTAAQTVATSYYGGELPFVTWTGSDHRIAWFERHESGDVGMMTADATFVATRVKNGVVDPLAERMLDASLGPLTAPRWTGSEYGFLAASNGALVLARTAARRHPHRHAHRPRCDGADVPPGIAGLDGTRVRRRLGRRDGQDGADRHLSLTQKGSTGSGGGIARMASARARVRGSASARPSRTASDARRPP